MIALIKMCVYMLVQDDNVPSDIVQLHFLSDYAGIHFFIYYF